MSTRSLALPLFCSIGIAIVLPASGAAKPPAPGRSGTKPDVQFCKDLAASGYLPWLSVGECIALNLSSDEEVHNFKVHSCDSLRDEGLLKRIYSSFSECVQDYERY